MIDYTSAEFLGLFLIGFPLFFYLTMIIFRGIYSVIENFLGEKNIFHHHFHYRDNRPTRRR